MLPTYREFDEPRQRDVVLGLVKFSSNMHASSWLRQCRAYNKESHDADLQREHSPSGLCAPCASHFFLLQNTGGQAVRHGTSDGRYPPVFYDSGHHGYCQQRPALLVNIIYSPEAASRRLRRRSACPASAVPVTDDRPPGLLAHPACGLMQSQFSAVGSRAFAAQESRPLASVALASSIAATESRQQATPPFACASEPRPVPPIAQTC